ncbi:6610_t:CDS:2, partial [Gigaspora rosea]
PNIEDSSSPTYQAFCDQLRIVVFGIGVSKNQDWNYVGTGYQSSLVNNIGKNQNQIKTIVNGTTPTDIWSKIDHKPKFDANDLFKTAVKRRAIAVHRAKVPKSYPDNGSDIRKMLESRRKQFREILEKEFDKRGQFKFALCSLTKFLIDDKPGNEKQGKKNSRTDWLRNKQIIVYNRAEIDNYLSDAFKQILYQVEERGGRSNA